MQRSITVNDMNTRPLHVLPMSPSPSHHSPVSGAVIAAIAAASGLVLLLLLAGTLMWLRRRRAAQVQLLRHGPNRNNLRTLRPLGGELARKSAIISAGSQRTSRAPTGHAVDAKPHGDFLGEQTRRVMQLSQAREDAYREQDAVLVNVRGSLPVPVLASPDFSTIQLPQLQQRLRRLSLYRVPTAGLVAGAVALPAQGLRVSARRATGSASASRYRQDEVVFNPTHVANRMDLT